MKPYYIFITLFSLLLFSCKKENSTIIDIGYDYFPIEKGTFVVYDVDSTFYDDFFIPTKAIKSRFQIKEKIADIFYDDQNRMTLRIERYVKPFDSIVPYSEMKWNLRNVWIANRTNKTAERVEENVRFVKLVFPIKFNKKWDANVQNVNDEENFIFSSIDQQATVGSISFDSVLQTESITENDILTIKKYSTEKYVKNIGLAYRQIIDIESQPDPEATTQELQLFYAIPITERITSGYQYTWVINTYGKE